MIVPFDVALPKVKKETGHRRRGRTHKSGWSWTSGIWQTLSQTRQLFQSAWGMFLIHDAMGSQNSSNSVVISRLLNDYRFKTRPGKVICVLSNTFSPHWRLFNAFCLLFRRGKAGRDWAWPFTPSNAEVENEWRSTFTPPMSLHVVYRDNFNFA